MRRNLVLVSSLLVFGLLGSAAAAFGTTPGSTVFGVSSSVDQVRFEGIKEATGQVVLTSSSAGTIATGSIITLTYGTNLAVAITTGNVSCTAATCVSGTNFSVAGATKQPVIKITFLTDVTFAVGNTITFSGVRVNANAFGSTGTISATAAALVPAAVASTNAITFSTGTTVPVANVHPLATTVSLSGGPAGILSCIATVATPFQLTITENFAQALTSLLDEQGLSGAAGVTQGSNILIAVTGVPKGATVAFAGVDLTTTATLVAALDASSTASVTAATANAEIDYVIDVNATDTTAIEALVLNFTVAAPVLASGLSPNALTATVSLTSLPTAAATPPVPDFTGTEGAATVAGISDCITNLLFPWVVVDAPGGTFDTGFAIANTTKDVFVTGGATAQNGSCVLTGFNNATGAAVPFTSPIGPIAAGETGTLVGSTDTALAGFRGYVIAVCQFQNGHGFAFITQDNMTANGTSQGYLALVIPTPSIQSRTAAGNGAKGEQLLH
jgi:hypothetical protein